MQKLLPTKSLLLAAFVTVGVVSTACKPQSAPQPKKQGATATTRPDVTTITRPDSDDLTRNTDLRLKIEASGHTGTEITVARGQTLNVTFRITGATVSADVATGLERAVNGVTFMATSTLSPSLTWRPTSDTATEQVVVIARDVRKCERLETDKAKCRAIDNGYKSSYDTRQAFTLKVGTSIIGGGGNNSNLIAQILPMLTGLLGGGGGGDISSILSGLSGSQLQGLLGQLSGSGGGSGGLDIGSILGMLGGSMSLTDGSGAQLPESSQPQESAANSSGH